MMYYCPELPKDMSEYTNWVVGEKNRFMAEGVDRVNARCQASVHGIQKWRDMGSPTHPPQPVPSGTEILLEALLDRP